MRIAVPLLSLALLGCSPPPAPATQDRLAALPACDTVEFSGALTPAECQLQAGEYTLAVTYQAMSSDAVVGAVSAEVFGSNGVAVQSMLEPDVAEYRAPLVQDVDGDGHADIIMVRAGGAANAEMALWVFSRERGLFERIGDVTSVAVWRTENGLIMAPARSSAVEWEVAFYQIDEGGLHPYASVSVTVPVGRATEPGCQFSTSPPRRTGDDLTTISQRRDELCAAAMRVYQ